MYDDQWDVRICPKYDNDPPHQSTTVRSSRFRLRLTTMPLTESYRYVLVRVDTLPPTVGRHNKTTDPTFPITKSPKITTPILSNQPRFGGLGLGFALLQCRLPTYILTNLLGGRFVIPTVGRQNRTTDPSSHNTSLPKRTTAPIKHTSECDGVEGPWELLLLSQSFAIDSDYEIKTGN